jgi:hypothetical protein
MLLTPILVTICTSSVLFMVRFLIAICGREGRAAQLGYLVQVWPEHDSGEDGESERDQDVFPQHADSPIPLGRVIPMYPHLLKTRRTTSRPSVTLPEGSEDIRHRL